MASRQIHSRYKEPIAKITVDPDEFDSAPVMAFKIDGDFSRLDGARRIRRVVGSKFRSDDNDPSLADWRLCLDCIRREGPSVDRFG